VANQQPEARRKQQRGDLALFGLRIIRAMQTSAARGKTAECVAKRCPAAPSAASSHACSFVEGALRVWFGTVLVLVNADLYLRHLLLRGHDFGSREPHRCSDRRSRSSRSRPPGEHVSDLGNVRGRVPAVRHRRF
jgi:hypothetical protein